MLIKIMTKFKQFNSFLMEWAWKEPRTSLSTPEPYSFASWW